MSAAFSPNKNLIEPASGSFNNAWAAPVNSNWAIIDQALGGTCIINVTNVAAGFYLLDIAQYQCLSFEFQGTLSANIGYVVPQGVGGQWTVLNSTNSGFSINFYVNGQTPSPGVGVGFPYGYNTVCWSDGTSMRYSDDGTANTAQANAQAYAYAQAQAAQSAAETYAYNQAQSAQSAAEGYANAVAGQAQTTANTAVTNAATAQTTANTAVSNAAAAQSTANTGVSNAATAQNTANTAVSNAATAQNTANAAYPTFGTNANGHWIKFPGGQIIQNGEIPSGYGNTYTQSYPIAFPNVCNSIVLTAVGAGSDVYTSQPGASKNSFVITVTDAGNQFSWVAYGS